MFNAAILEGTTVVNIIVLNDLSECDGAVVCTEWVCIGDDISKPKPEVVETSVNTQPISTGSQTL